MNIQIAAIVRISIAAPAETIYHAITTEDGIRAWWTTDVNLIGGASVLASRFLKFFSGLVSSLAPPSWHPTKCC